MNEFHIAFASDERFSLQLRVAVGSVLAACFKEKSKAQPIVHVLDCGLEDSTWSLLSGECEALAERFGARCAVNRHNVPMEMFDRFPVWHSSRATYARLLLPEILPTVAQCVYSDCDVLFLRNPADILSQMQELGVAIIGHRNPLDESGTSVDWRWFEKVHEPYNRNAYCCAGLIGMNLDVFRTLGAGEKILSFLSRHEDAVAPDQCALNWFFRESSAVFKDGWGVWPDEVYSWEGPVGAIHYQGGRPWNDFSWYECVMERDLDDLWRDLCRLITGEDCFWRMARRNGVCVGRVVRILASMLRLLDMNCPGRPHFMDAYRRREAGRGRVGALHAALVAGFDGVMIPQEQNCKLE